MPPPAQQGKRIWGTVTVGKRGQIVIPKAVRDRFALKGGDRLIVGSDELGLALIPAGRFEDRMREYADRLSDEQ